MQEISAEINWKPSPAPWTLPYDDWQDKHPVYIYVRICAVKSSEDKIRSTYLNVIALHINWTVSYILAPVFLGNKTLKKSTRGAHSWFTRCPSISLQHPSALVHERLHKRANATTRTHYLLAKLPSYFYLPNRYNATNCYLIRISWKYEIISQENTIITVITIRVIQLRDCILGQIGTKCTNENFANLLHISFTRPLLFHMKNYLKNYQRLPF